MSCLGPAGKAKRIAVDFIRKSASLIAEKMKKFVGVAINLRNKVSNILATRKD